jgi:hypothetical protein
MFKCVLAHCSTQWRIFAFQIIQPFLIESTLLLLYRAWPAPTFKVFFNSNPDSSEPPPPHPPPQISQASPCYSHILRSLRDTTLHNATHILQNNNLIPQLLYLYLHSNYNNGNIKLKPVLRFIIINPINY